MLGVVAEPLLVEAHGARADLRDGLRGERSREHLPVELADLVGLLELAGQIFQLVPVRFVRGIAARCRQGLLKSRIELAHRPCLVLSSDRAVRGAGEDNKVVRGMDQRRFEGSEGHQPAPDGGFRPRRRLQTRSAATVRTG